MYDKFLSYNFIKRAIKDEYLKIIRGLFSQVLHKSICWYF